MPKCKLCLQSQRRLHKNRYCKECTNNKNTDIDLYKMTPRDDEYINLLKEQVQYLEDEMTYKNELIDTLLMEMKCLRVTTEPKEKLEIIAPNKIEISPAKESEIEPVQITKENDVERSICEGEKLKL